MILSVYKLEVYNTVIHNFKRLFSICSYYEIFIIFPVLHNISLQLIYCMYSGLSLLIPYPCLALPPSPHWGLQPTFPSLLSLGLFTHHTVSFPTFAQAVSTAQKSLPACFLPIQHRSFCLLHPFGFLRKQEDIFRDTKLNLFRSRPRPCSTPAGVEP